MKKKILFLVFILSLALCLAFASSASDYYEKITDIETNGGRYGYATNNYSSFESTLEYELGVFYSPTLIGYSNIEKWEILLSSYNITTLEEFTNFITVTAVDLGYWSSSNGICYFINQDIEAYYNAFQNYMNNGYFYSLVDCQNFHVLRNMYYTFDYNGVTYKSVIEQFCPKCNYTSYELSSDVLNFLDVFLDTATDDEILNFDFYNTLKLYIFENEGANVSNAFILDEFVDKLEQIGYTVGYDEGINDFNTHTSHIIEQYNEYCSINSIEQSLSSFEEYLSLNFSQYLTYYNLGVNELAELMYSVSSGGSEYNEGYTQGKIDGVTEFKTTEEYKSQYTTGYSDGYSKGEIDGVVKFKTTEEYKSQYTTGYTNGIAEFKASDGYAETLLIEREIGQAEGVNAYLASEEYENALQAEYDNGYNTATTEQEQKQMKNNLGVILGTCGIVIVGLLFVYFLMSRKKHRKR